MHQTLDTARTRQIERELEVAPSLITRGPVHEVRHLSLRLPQARVEGPLHVAGDLLTRLLRAAELAQCRALLNVDVVLRHLRAAARQLFRAAARLVRLCHAGSPDLAVLPSHVDRRRPVSARPRSRRIILESL
jgi:hypothetical protein